MRQLIRRHEQRFLPRLPFAHCHCRSPPGPSWPTHDGRIPCPSSGIIQRADRQRLGERRFHKWRRRFAGGNAAGGGIYVVDAGLTITSDSVNSSVVSGNVAQGYGSFADIMDGGNGVGGGIYYDGPSGALVGVYFAGNSASGGDALSDATDTATGGAGDAGGFRRQYGPERDVQYGGLRSSFQRGVRRARGRDLYTMGGDASNGGLDACPTPPWS